MAATAHSGAIGRAAEVFRRGGLREATRACLSEWLLILFADGATATIRSWAQDSGGRSLYAVGTVAYRELGYRDSLNALLADMTAGRLDRGQLSGAYCLIYFDGTRVTVMTDPSGMYHVFASHGGRVLASSFNAAVAAMETQPRVDRASLLEQLTTGVVAPPDTLFEGVQALDPGTQAVQRELGGISFATEAPSLRADVEVLHEGLDDCVERLVGAGKNTFRKFRQLAGECGASVGVSAGYDSRLLLVLAKAVGMSPTTHTFQSTAHTAEARIAEEVAAAAGFTCEHVRVRLWEGLSEGDVTENIDDALSFYDGCPNQTMGTFNDVHTARIRRQALGGLAFGLNGLGGELLRNREHLRPGKLGADEWLRYYVLTPQGVAALTNRAALGELLDRLKGKYGRLMGFGEWHRFDRHAARRFYRRVWLPSSAGNRLCAENRISFSWMPFAEEPFAGEALKSTPNIGSGGALESAMIVRMAPEMAAVPSGYGHALSSEPLTVQLRNAAIGQIPTQLRNAYGALRIQFSSIRSHEALLARPGLDLPRRGLLLLRELDLPIKWERLLADRVSRDLTLYTAATVARCAAEAQTRIEGC